MKPISLFILVISFPILSYSQLLKFKAIKVQFVLNDKYGYYIGVSEETTVQGGSMDIEFNFSNEILYIANKTAGDFNIKGVIENYDDTLAQSWTILRCIDKDGNSCIARLCFTPKDRIYDAILFIDYKEKTIIYKMVKDPTK